jgi:hypothetical protein
VNLLTSQPTRKKNAIKKEFRLLQKTNYPSRSVSQQQPARGGNFIDSHRSLTFLFPLSPIQGNKTEIDAALIVCANVPKPGGSNDRVHRCLSPFCSTNGHLLAAFVLSQVFYCVCGRNGLLQRVLISLLCTVNSGIIFIFLFRYLPRQSTRVWAWAKATFPKNSA